MKKVKKMALGGMGAQPPNLQAQKRPIGQPVARAPAQPPRAMPAMPPQSMPRSTRIGGIFGGQAQRAQQAIQTQQAAQKRAQAQAEQVRHEQVRQQQAQQKPLERPTAPYNPQMDDFKGSGSPSVPFGQAIGQMFGALGQPKMGQPQTQQSPYAMKKGGMVSSKSKTSSASSRGDGIATKGKTKGRFV